MSNKIKYIITTVLFSAFVAVFSVLCVIRAFHPVIFSDVEKRNLALFPSDISWESIVDKTTIDEFEDFTVDQFPLREFFRTIKANFALGVLGMKENNSYAMVDGSIAEIKPSFTQEIVDYQLGRLQYTYDKYLANNGGDHYAALIPDKNYFFGKDHGYLAPDYDALTEQFKAALSGTTYIDLFGSLSLDDYYKTDWHWNQAQLGEVLSTLGDAMGFGDRISGDYTENVLENFHGGYYDQSALYPKAEQLVYLTNGVLEDCTVYDYETGKTYDLYNEELYESKTQYDFFLSGTRALLRIDNPNATTDEELIVLRDSFGSSLVPLIAQGYSSVYVVDIRYIHPDIVTKMIDVQDKDVLCIYSTTILNTKGFK